MPGQIVDEGGVAQNWVAGAELLFDVRPSNIKRGLYLVVRGVVTAGGGFTLPNRLSSYGLRLLERLELSRDSEIIVRQEGIDNALVAEFDGWKSATLNNVPGVAGAGTYQYERVYPIRFNPDDLMSVYTGMPYEVDVRGTSNLTLRVACGQLATAFGPNQTFVGTVALVVANDFVISSPKKAQAEFSFRRRIITTTQHTLAAGVQTIVPLPQDGMLRRVSLAAVNNAGHCSDAVIGRTQMVLNGGAYPFDHNFPQLAAYTRARAASELSGTLDLSGTGAVGGFAVLSFDDDGMGLRANVIDAKSSQPTLLLTGAAPGTLWVTTELIRVPVV